MLTKEQLQALLEMPDVLGSEEETAQQLALANQLRNSASSVSNRTDVGSNIGRAGFGVAGAMRDYQSGKSLSESAKRRKALIEALRGKQEPELLNQEL